MKTVGALCLAVLSLSAHAAAPQWEIVPKDSNLSFTATQNAAPVSGEFSRFSGEIFVDPLNYKTSTIHIIVDMNSITASYAELKSTLITADWFNVKMFPKAEFKASDFSKTGSNSYQANGQLTIRDKSVPVSLTFTAEQLSGDKGVVKGSTVLKRSAFGVGQGDWSGTDEIKDEVKVNFKVTAVKAAKH